MAYFNNRINGRFAPRSRALVPYDAPGLPTPYQSPGVPAPTSAPGLPSPMAAAGLPGAQGGAGLPAVPAGGGPPASTNWDWFRKMLMGGGGAPSGPQGLPQQPAPAALPAPSGAPAGSLLGSVGPGASLLSAVQAMHALAPDDQASLDSRHRHRMTEQQALRDRMDAQFGPAGTPGEMGPQMPPGFTGPQQGPQMPPGFTGPQQGPPMPPGLGSLGGPQASVPLPQARPQGAPQGDPMMVPGYNPAVPNMADPTQSIQRFGEGTRARQVPDGNGGMMNDFYLGDPHQSTNGPALIQRMLAYYQNK